MRNGLQGHIAPVAVYNTERTKRRLIQGLSRYGGPRESLDAPTVKRNGHRLITDAALCIASSSKLKYGYRPEKVNACMKSEGMRGPTLICSKNLKHYQNANKEGEVEPLTSQKDPALPERRSDRK